MSEPKRVKIGSTGLPRGVEKGLRTMRQGEACVLTVQPIEGYGYGEEGDAERGVPGGAVLEYEISLDTVMQVVHMHDGQLTKTTLRRGRGWETPSKNAEVTVRWSARVKAEESKPFVDG